MSQISPPIRILLVGSVLLAAVWVLVLKPKSDDGGTPASTPSTPVTQSADPVGGAATNGVQGDAQTKLGKAVEAAEGAAAKVNERNQAVDPSTSTAVTPGTGAATQSQSQTESQSSSTTAADSALADVPQWLAKAMDEKVVALMFWNKNAADDRATHAALKDSYKAHGKVLTRSVPIERIAKYGDVARGVDVAQSPTIMFIDRDRKATSLVGYSDLEAINQSIIDSLLATDRPIERVEYLQKLRGTCTNVRDKIFAMTPPDTMKELNVYLDGLQTRLDNTRTRIRGLNPPAAYRGMDKKLNRVMKLDSRNLSSLRSGLKGGGLDAIAFRRTAKKSNQIWAPVSLDMAAAGLNECR